MIVIHITFMSLLIGALLYYLFEKSDLAMLAMTGAAMAAMAVAGTFLFVAAVGTVVALLYLPIWLIAS